jgi:predicted nucleotide-binding protein (sugar kinase/HSP70/actin superfamily)
MQPDNRHDFRELSNNLGKINVRGKTVLIPEMNRIGAHLFASTFRSFGVNAEVLESNKGCDLGRQFTSGKECYPCQVTLGDILHFAETKEQQGGQDFNPEDYIYFLPEASGPCRFGMYNKYQRIVLNSFPGLNRLKIVSPTTTDGYSLDGMLEKDKIQDFKKAGYFSFVVADILDRLTWRVRPYEKEEGLTNEFIKTATFTMGDAFKRYGAQGRFDKILSSLTGISKGAREIINPVIPQKPLIGIVGEIFLRMHTGANQDLILLLEKHGAEVVNASMTEWVNYITYNKLREAREGLRFSFKQLKWKDLHANLKNIAGFGGNLLYQEFRQKKAYDSIAPFIDLPRDHKISHLKHAVEKEDLYSFQLVTETCISVGAILEYARMGFNGVVNVYPLSCMPGMATSAVVRPVMNENRIPYLDTPYDGTSQPGREAAIRTFVYQADQHFRQNGRNAGSIKDGTCTPGVNRCDTLFT